VFWFPSPFNADDRTTFFTSPSFFFSIVPLHDVLQFPLQVLPANFVPFLRRTVYEFSRNSDGRLAPLPPSGIPSCDCLPPPIIDSCSPRSTGAFTIDPVFWLFPPLSESLQASFSDASQSPLFEVLLHGASKPFADSFSFPVFLPLAQFLFPVPPDAGAFTLSVDIF